MNPTISTVILFFNKPSLTLRCVETTFKAARGKNQLYFLVDNGSTTPHRTLIEDQVRTLCRQYDIPLENINWITLRPNRGFATGMNAGLREAFSRYATPDFVVTLSNDVEVASDFFKALEPLALASAQEEPGIFCPTIHHLMKKDEVAFTHGTLDLTTYTLSHHKNPIMTPLYFPQYYPAAAMVWTPLAFERLGGFDERFFCYWEDVYLSFCAKIKKVALRPAPQLVASHLGRGTTGRHRLSRQHFHHGQTLFKKLYEVHL